MRCPIVLKHGYISIFLRVLHSNVFIFRPVKTGKSGNLPTTTSAASRSAYVCLIFARNGLNLGPRSANTERFNGRCAPSKTDWHGARACVHACVRGMRVYSSDTVNEKPPTFPLEPSVREKCLTYTVKDTIMRDDDERASNSQTGNVTCARLCGACLCNTHSEHSPLCTHTHIHACGPAPERSLFPTAAGLHGIHFHVVILWCSTLTGCNSDTNASSINRPISCDCMLVKQC